MTRTAISIIHALFAVQDVVSTGSTSCPGGGGATAIVEAYARPPVLQPFVYRRYNSSNNKCICAKPSIMLARGLRCGGVSSDAIISRPRRGATALSMTRSEKKDDTMETKNNAKCHLIWSPNFWKKMAISVILLCMAQIALKNSKVISGGLENLLFSRHDSRPCHKVDEIRSIFSTAVVLPLLSSSCCALQLLINAVSGLGCAGFNTYLGPIRPILLSIMLFSTWKLLPQRSFGWTILSLTLAFLPELVDIWNTNRSRRWRQLKHADGNSDAESASTIAMSNPLTAKLRLDIPTMGCVACVNKVDASIRQCKSAGSIKEEASWLTEGTTKGGMAEITISARTSEEIDAIAQEVEDAVKNAGFQCKVESLKVGEK